MNKFSFFSKMTFFLLPWKVLASSLWDPCRCPSANGLNEKRQEWGIDRPSEGVKDAGANQPEPANWFPESHNSFRWILLKSTWSGQINSSMPYLSWMIGRSWRDVMLVSNQQMYQCAPRHAADAHERTRTWDQNISLKKNHRNKWRIRFWTREKTIN